jgi:tRNA threonylcarbamoyladenosine biosynthesis protein TsaE
MLLTMSEEELRKEIAEFETRSREETVRLGRRLGERLGPGDVVALIGELGAGKTTLAKGIAAGAGVGDENEVTSPTFVLVNEYRGRFPVYHADLYRLQEAPELEDLGWEEIIYGDGISLLEWAEKIPEALPEARIEVRITWIGAEKRRFVVSGRGAQADVIVQLQKNWKKEE